MQGSSIDKNTYKVLRFIYNKQECVFSDLCNYLEIPSIQELSPAIASVLFLFKCSFISVYNPKLTVMDSVSLETYKRACEQKSLPLLSTDCKLCIMPNGSAYVESKIDESKKFQRQLNTLEEIANASKKQSEAALKQLDIMQDQLDLARSEAKGAKKDAFYARILSVIAIIVAFSVPFIERLLELLSTLF